MGRFRAVAAAGVMLALGSVASEALGSSVRTESASAWAGSPQTVVVGYVDHALLARAAHLAGARIVRTVPQLRSAELRTRGPAAQIARRLTAEPGIRYAEPASPRAPQIEPPLFAGPQAT